MLTPAELAAHLRSIERTIKRLRAADIHSCHPGCTRAGCVRARDEALMRRALEALLAPRDAQWQPINTRAVAALRERLGEKT